MSDNMQAKVLSMLENYISNARMIALLRFELDHSFRVSAEDAISAMNFAHGDGGSASTGHISDKTAYIMMRYQDEMKEANEELNGKVATQLWDLEQKQERLLFYVSLLEPNQEEVIRLHYFEGKSRDAVCEQLDISSSTYDKTRKKGVDRLAEMYEMTTGLRNG